MFFWVMSGVPRMSKNFFFHEMFLSDVKMLGSDSGGSGSARSASNVKKNFFCEMFFWVMSKCEAVTQEGQVVPGVPRMSKKFFFHEMFFEWCQKLRKWLRMVR
jgi:hypothetical protein